MSYFVPKNQRRVASSFSMLNLASPNLPYSISTLAILLQRQARPTKGFGNHKTLVDPTVEIRVAVVLLGANRIPVRQKFTGVTSHRFVSSISRAAYALKGPVA